MASFEITGLEELLRDMEELPRVLAKTIIVVALRKGAEPIRKRAAELAPDDPETPGSRIRDNMNTVISVHGSTSGTAFIGPSPKGFPGIFAELGTAHQTAKPFLGPAFDQKVEEAVKIIAEELGAAIEDVLGHRGGSLADRQAEMRGRMEGL